jgi:hypothetical protein
MEINSGFDESFKADRINEIKSKWIASEKY